MKGPVQTTKKPRKNKRKARTEVSSSSSSSESEASSPKRQQKHSPSSSSSSGSEADDSRPAATEDSDVEPVQLNEGPDAVVIPQRKSEQDPEQAFEEFYLRQATKEFSEDLEKLRTAPDFNDRSVPVLIRALKQGTACFSQEEKVRVGSALGT